MTIAIRRLLPTDAAAFQQLRLAALLDTPAAFGSSHDEEKDRSLDEVARGFEEGRRPAVLGAFDAGSLVGCVGLALDARAKFAHKGHVWGLYVAPVARGRGVARELMRALLAQARATPGIERVTLVADAGNVAAIALYESLGFAVFGREPDAMRLAGRSHDDVHMALRLADAR